MKRSRFFSFCLVLMLSAVLLLSGCGGESTPAAPSDSEEPPPAPVLAEDDVTLPSIMSFANYELEPEGEKDRDGYTTVFYDLWRDDAFTQEYLDLLTQNYHFSLRSSGLYKDENDSYLGGAIIYYLDYTGTAPIVGFSDNDSTLGEIHDVDLQITVKKTGFAIHFADGLVWTDTDDRSVIFADPIVPPDADYILPSIESFSNYQLWPKEEHEKDGYTILFYDLKRDDTFVQEYVDLLTEQYHFSLRLTAPYRAGVDDNYFAGADVYYFDYTGTEPIVGFTSKATDVEGVHDVEVAMVIRKNGFSINFADGLAWLYTDEYSTVFGGSEPQQPPKDGGYEGDDDDDRRPRRCAVCSGKGYTEEYVSTPNYSGSGSSSSTERVRCFSCGGDGEDDCYACRGSGEKDCPSCGGSGER